MGRVVSVELLNAIHLLKVTANSIDRALQDLESIDLEEVEKSLIAYGVMTEADPDANEHTALGLFDIDQGGQCLTQARDAIRSKIAELDNH